MKSPWDCCSYYLLIRRTWRLCLSILQALAPQIVSPLQPKRITWTVQVELRPQGGKQSSQDSSTTANPNPHKGYTHPARTRVQPWLNSSVWNDTKLFSSSSVCDWSPVTGHVQLASSSAINNYPRACGWNELVSLWIIAFLCLTLLQMSDTEQKGNFKSI